MKLLVVNKTCVLLLLLFFSTPLAWAKEISQPAKAYPKVMVLTTTYFAHRWSDYGCYRRVSKNGKRLGEYVACNFLPAGSMVMIPSLFKTTKLIVADTLAGAGTGYFHGKKYWRLDILRNKNEWIDDFDTPQELIVFKIKTKGVLRDAVVKNNYKKFLQTQAVKLP